MWLAAGQGGVWECTSFHDAWREPLIARGGALSLPPFLRGQLRLHGLGPWPTSNSNDTNTMAHVEATQTASGGDEENEDVEGRYENRHYRNRIDNG